jgi:hypothetical protein
VERSKLVESLTGKFTQLLREGGVGRTLVELVSELGTTKPASPPSVRNYVGKGISVDGKDDPLAGLYRVDDVGCTVAKVSYPNLHVLQRSITFDGFSQATAGRRRCGSLSASRS